MTDEPTHPLTGDAGRPVGAPGRPPADPARRPPADPWAASAPVIPPAYVSAEPSIIVVGQPRRRRWPWLLGGLAFLALVCCVGAVVFWTPISREYPARLELGDGAAGLDRLRDPDIDRATDRLLVQMFRQNDIDDGLAAVLVDPAAPERKVVLLAATMLVLDPAKALNQAIDDISDRAVRNLTDYHRLGPAMTCADTEDDEAQPVVVCAWVDHGSVGAGIFYGGWAMDDAARTLRDLRDAVVRRG